MINFVLRLLFFTFLRCNMKKCLLFFAFMVSFLIPANIVYADPVGGFGSNYESVEESIENATTESSTTKSSTTESSNLDDYLDGNDSVDIDNIDEPIDNYINQTVDRLALLGHIDCTIGGHYSSVFGGGGRAFRYDVVATPDDSSAVLFFLYYPDHPGEMQYELYCRDNTTLSSLSEIRNGVGFTVEGEFISYVQSTSGWSNGDIDDHINGGSGVNFYTFNHGGGVFTTADLNTTIPVFDTSSSTALDDVNSYIESLGTDYSGAVNSDYVQLARDRANLSYVNSSDDVPYPEVNATETFDSNDEDVFKPRTGMAVTISGYGSETRDMKLAYDVQVGAQCTNSAGKDFTLSYKYFYMGMPIASDTNGIFFDKQYLFNDVSQWIHSCSDIKRVNRLYVRVRFRDNLKASNWVQVVFANGVATSTGYMQDNDGNYVDNEDYNGGSLPGTVDSGYSPGGFLGDNISYFMSYIRGGFGLLDGGLLSLLANTFRYIPGSIWDLFKAYISAIIIVTMIVLIVRAVAAIASAVGSAITGIGK